MNNPFLVRWLKGWSFQIVLMEGNVKIEAHGFGICLRTSLRPGESPRAAADRLVQDEDLRRRSLYNSWIKGQTSNISTDNIETEDLKERHEDPRSLVVVR